MKANADSQTQRDDPNNPGNVVIPPDVLDKDFWQMVIKYQFIYSVCGLVIAFLTVVLGMVLVFHGIGNGNEWSAEFFGIKINDAAPGLVLFVIGLAMAQFTKFDVGIANLTNPKNGLLARLYTQIAANNASAPK